MAGQYVVRRDTPAWLFQTWVAFAVSVFLCAAGVWNMPGEGLERSMLALGYLFCLSSALTLAKTIRDNRDEQVDTSAWLVQVWAAFGIANVLTGWGLLGMNAGGWQKAYMGSSWFFMLSASFTLAKTVRDNHEADLLDQASPAPKTLPTGAAQSLPKPSYGASAPDPGKPV